MDAKIINGYRFVPYIRTTYTTETAIERSKSFYVWMNERRTVRDFSDKAVPQAVIENIVLAAGTAPSGAHKQPWTFCLVSNPNLKRQIRAAAEEEERISYQGRMSEEWLQDLAPLQTDWEKPFLETAPWLIIVFRRSFEYVNGHKHQNYYVSESVGIACGMLLTAVHQAGLVALTHTPSPMNFLTKLLARPDNEKPYLLIPVGYPAQDVFVPDLHRKNLDEIAVYY